MKKSKKTKVRRGWGLVLRGKVTEVVIGKKKPHHDYFFDGQYSSKIIHVKVIYENEKG